MIFFKVHLNYYFLGAFWPALQVLSGNVLQGQRTFLRFEEIWDKYGAIPDIFDFKKQNLLHYGRDYPLRPEMVRKEIFSNFREGNW